jgi:hypothetical protein
MKKQGNMYPSNINNSTIKDLNDNEADKISNNERKRTMIKMINKRGDV